MNRFDVLFSAPYSPFVNPIEEYFLLLKFYFRRWLSKGHCDLTTMITNSIMDAKENNLISYYKHVFDYLEDFINLNDIYT